MAFYVIERPRLILLLTESKVQHDRFTVLNWWHEDGEVLHITIRYLGLDYIYREAIKSIQDLSIEIRQYLTSDRAVLGYFTPEELFSDDDPDEPDEPTNMSIHFFGVDRLNRQGWDQQ